VSDVEGELARVRGAFAKPTLTLLARKWAPVVLSIFVSSFSRDQDAIAAERFHAQVTTYLAELRSTGEEVPEGSARALCRRWVSEQWRCCRRMRTTPRSTRSPRMRRRRSTT
jgi:Protein of unknown function (DUF3375)